MMSEQIESEQEIEEGSDMIWEDLVERDELEYQQWLLDQEDPDERTN